MVGFEQFGGFRKLPPRVRRVDPVCFLFHSLESCREASCFCFQRSRRLGCAACDLVPLELATLG